MKKLTRSYTDRKLAGILGGMAQYIGIDSTLLRVIFIILLFPSGFFPLIITYILLTFVIPNEKVDY